MLDHPVDGGDHLRDIGGPVGRGDLHVEQPGAGRHTQVLGAAGRRHRGDAVVASGDDPGQVGAVPVGVEMTKVVGLGLEGEVGAVDDLVRVGESGYRGDAGVDDGHVHALAAETGVPEADCAGGERRQTVDRRRLRVPGCGQREGECLGQTHRATLDPGVGEFVPVEIDGGIRRDRDDTGMVPDHRQLSGRHLGCVAVDDAELQPDPAAQPFDEAFGSLAGSRCFAHDHRNQRGRGGGGCQQRCDQQERQQKAAHPGCPGLRTVVGHGRHVQFLVLPATTPGDRESGRNLGNRSARSQGH